MTYSRRSPCTLTPSTPPANKGNFHSTGPCVKVVLTSLRCSPETVIVLRAVSSFEALYLSRSTARLNEVIATAVRQQPPGAPEGLAISRTVVNELDSARFDPLLVKNVAKNVGTALEMLVARSDTLVRIPMIFY